MDFKSIRSVPLVAIEPRSQVLVCEWSGSELNVIENADSKMPRSAAIDLKLGCTNFEPERDIPPLVLLRQEMP